MLVNVLLFVLLKKTLSMLIHVHWSFFEDPYIGSDVHKTKEESYPQ